MKKISIFIDRITETISNLLVIALLSMILIACISIILRFLFNISFVSIQELIMYLHASIFMLGISYALKENSHVKIDVLLNTFNDKIQKLIGVFGMIVFLIPTSLFIVYISSEMVIKSWQIFEGSSEAGGMNLVYVLKTLIPIMAILMLLQSLSILIKKIGK